VGLEDGMIVRICIGFWFGGLGGLFVGHRLSLVEVNRQLRLGEELEIEGWDVVGTRLSYIYYVY
jgi:hypothetical protein